MWYFFMKRNFDVLFSCMDYDKAGIKMAIKLRRVYGITPIMFTKEFKVKDFAEYVAKYGTEKTQNLIQTVFDRYKHDLYSIDAYNYHLLKNIK